MAFRLPPYPSQHIFPMFHPPIFHQIKSLVTQPFVHKSAVMIGQINRYITIPLREKRDILPRHMLGTHLPKTIAILRSSALPLTEAGLFVRIVTIHLILERMPELVGDRLSHRFHRRRIDPQSSDHIIVSSAICRPRGRIMDDHHHPDRIDVRISRSDKIQGIMIQFIETLSFFE